jgi:hypothetical protein
MTADEIRKKRDDLVGGRIDGSLDSENAAIFFLAEIAAQLAELKQMLEPRIRTVRVFRRRYRGSTKA